MLWPPVLCGEGLRSCLTQLATQRDGCRRRLPDCAPHPTAMHVHQSRSQEARSNWEAALASKDRAISQLEEALASRQRAIEQLLSLSSHAAEQDLELQERNAKVGGDGEVTLRCSVGVAVRRGGVLAAVGSSGR
jgi:hypothetical protein